MANGREVKYFLREMKGKPQVICIQETFLKPVLDLVIYGYVGIRRDRSEGEGAGGGCVTFIKRGISYRVLEIGTEQESRVVEVWEGERSLLVLITIIHVKG